MKSSIAAAFLSLVFGPFGIFCLAWAFIYSVRGELLSAVVALGAAAFLLSFVAMLGLVASKKVQPRAAAGPAGSEIRPDRRVDRLAMIWTVGGLIAMATYAIFAPLDMLAIEAPSRDERYFVVACSIATLIGMFSLRQLVKHRSASFLRMTTDGIETGNTMTTAVRSWDEIADIADRPRNAGRPNGATYFVTADGRTRELPSHWYTPGGSAIHQLVRFYWQHPEAREELIDGRALARLEAETT
jgi:hypothetical protein